MSNKPNAVLVRRIADALVAGILTGPDWPNDQRELTRLQAAELLRMFASQIEESSAISADAALLDALRDLKREADLSPDYRPEFRRAIASAHAALAAAEAA